MIHVFAGEALGELLLKYREVEEAKFFSYERAVELDFAFGYRKVVNRIHEIDLINT